MPALSDGMKACPSDVVQGIHMSPWLTVIGIGEDGFKGLGRNARHAVLRARGSSVASANWTCCQCACAANASCGRARFPWRRYLARRGEPVCVLASGDPMFYGVGASLARQVPAEEMLILPAPSSVSLAAARLGWAVAGRDDVDRWWPGPWRR